MISGAFTITWDLVVILNFSMDKYTSILLLIDKYVYMAMQEQGILPTKHLRS